MVRGTLRQRILGSVGALVLLSLFGSAMSLYRITEVNRRLDAINRVSVPLGHLLVQLRSDADIYLRELDRRLGSAHWSEPRWRPRPVPRWIEDVLDSELDRAARLVSDDGAWPGDEARDRWNDWLDAVTRGHRSVREQTQKLQAALERGDLQEATRLHPAWSEAVEGWSRQVQSGSLESERSLRETFARAQEKVAALRTGLELILGAVVSLSLLLLWLGERALRPLVNLTRFAREIARRSLRREDKALLPPVPLSRNDEVSALAREFNRMATALIEREIEVESHKGRLQEQNRLLRELGELNQNVLDSMKAVILVTDPGGRITQGNRVATEWLGASLERIRGTSLSDWPRISGFEGSALWLRQLASGNAGLIRIEARPIDGRVYGGHLLPLRSEPLPGRREAPVSGAILTLEDLTDELVMGERLRHAEKLAAVGQMSAQVAHEVRNPLHSIGLEAEIASDLATRLGGSSALRQSLQSILASVDRLEKITENYLKLSRLSAGERSEFDLGEALEATLAMYAPLCEAQGVQVDWSRPAGARLTVLGDRDLIEQVLGNLLRNSVQAGAGRIGWKLGAAESGRIWIRVEDDGPGIPPEIRARLFTPFVTSRAEGTGLGLSFVKKVIEDHGGAVSCPERASGEGACFEILLPQAAPESGARARAAQPPRFNPPEASPT